MTVLDEDGLSVGEFYVYNEGSSTRIIPRSHISSVTADYRSRPALLVLGGVAVALGLWLVFGSAATLQGLIAIVVGLALVAWFFTSRRVGIQIASSGGEIFIEVRGRRRFEMLEYIYADLEGASGSAPAAR